jgi:hypothetical protein
MVIDGARTVDGHSPPIERRYSLIKPVRVLSRA